MIKIPCAVCRKEGYWVGPGKNDFWKEPEDVETAEASQRLKQERVLLWLSQVECGDVDHHPNDDVSSVSSPSVFDLKSRLVVMFAVVVLAGMYSR